TRRVLRIWPHDSRLELRKYSDAYGKRLRISSRFLHCTAADSKCVESRGTHAGSVMSRLSKYPRLVYLCMDSGVAVLRTKGASVHLRSICGALMQAGCRVFLHCNRVGGDRSLAKAFCSDCTEHVIPDGLKRLQRDLRTFYGAQLRLPAEV